MKRWWRFYNDTVILFLVGILLIWVYGEHTMGFVAIVGGSIQFRLGEVHQLLDDINTILWVGANKE